MENCLLPHRRCGIIIVIQQAPARPPRPVIFHGAAPVVGPL